ncbi:hypothetical protein G7Y89_g15090 [Cudoniella acicularis]|uniref:Phospholipase/carboxylesterase/thioesterase domain-containing protein n=1 Tax=Cudoniella acicularis TaxID=354080 RepID=A0A8H4QUF4_9HELO|nr:hypothetical protein G7Y89_g15090 [Cudoniella acicularis]
MASDAYPPPHIIHPSGGEHKTTLILLHGTSTSGPELAASLFSIPLASDTTSTDCITLNQDLPSVTLTSQKNLESALPYTRIVFPTGKPRKTTVFNGKETNAWFDVADFSDRTKGEDLQIPGIRESIIYLCSLIQEEIYLLSDQGRESKGRIVIGGFSQGAAMSFMLLLSGELLSQNLSHEIGAWTLLSGWTPFRAQIEKAMFSPPFPDDKASPQEIYALRREKTRDALWDILELPALASTSIDTQKQWEEKRKVFMAHGTQDTKVRTEWGKQSRDLLKNVGLHIQWKEYQGLEHWFNADELRDLVSFVGGIWARNGVLESDK